MKTARAEPSTKTRRAAVMGRGNPEAKLEKFKTRRSAPKKVAPAKAAPIKHALEPRGVKASKRVATKNAAKPAPAAWLKTLERWLNDTKFALESPHANTLEQLGARASLNDALLYVAVSALFTGWFTVRGGLPGVVVTALLGIAAFALLVGGAHLYAVRQGDRAKPDALAYASALYWAPLAPFTALVPLVFGAAWIPAAVLVQVFASALYMQRVLNGTRWLSYSQQWNALTVGLGAACVGVLTLSFVLVPFVLRR
jgi:hypothetical protein